MKGKGSKNKGGEYERVVNRKLSLWLSKGERSDLFIRNVSSGGAYTISASRGKAQGVPGDAIAVHPLAYDFQQHFFCEYKHWHDLTLESALWGKGEFYKVICDAERQSVNSHRYYFIVAKQNYRPALIFVPYIVGEACFAHHAINFGLYHVFWGGKVFVWTLEAALSVNPEEFLQRVPVYKKKQIALRGTL